MRPFSRKQPAAAYHHGDLRRALVDAALVMLQADASAASISMRAVSRMADVSPNAPYRHFPNKASLLSAVAARGFEQLHGLLKAADRKAGEGGAVAAQGAAYVRFALQNAALFRLMFGPQKDDASPELEAASAATYAMLADRLRQQHSTDVEAVRRALANWSLMHGYATLALDGRVADKGRPEDVIAELLTLPALSSGAVEGKPAGTRRRA